MPNHLKAIDGQRECVVCGKTKPEDSFIFMKKAGYYSSNCKACENDRSHEKARARMRILNAYKRLEGCVDCGYNLHGAALDFDHLPGTSKSFNIGVKARYAPWDDILNEMQKCEIVCANCHRIRTVQRASEGRDEWLTTPLIGSSPTLQAA